MCSRSFNDDVPSGTKGASSVYPLQERDTHNVTGLHEIRISVV